MDDSCVGSSDRQTHLRHLEAFLTDLTTNDLAIHLDNCVLAAPSLEILGHTILVVGAAPMADHAAKIELCPPPQDIKQLQHLHISHGQTTAYHPESNGAVERLHRHLKDALHARAASET